ncbi:MAG: hypothetical protein WBJ54_03285, partial [Syntrophorhabdus sp.]
SIRDFQFSLSAKFPMVLRPGKGQSPIHAWPLVSNFVDEKKYDEPFVSSIEPNEYSSYLI